MALQAGLVSEGGGKMGFTEAYASQEDEVLLLVDEVEPEGVLDLLAVDGFGPVPVELVDGFYEGKAGGFDAPFDGAGSPLKGFALDEADEVVDVATRVFCGLTGFVLVMVAYPCEFEVGEVFVELLGFVFHALGSFGVL